MATRRAGLFTVFTSATAIICPNLLNRSILSHWVAPDSLPLLAKPGIVGLRAALLPAILCLSVNSRKVGSGNSFDAQIHVGYQYGSPPSRTAATLGAAAPEPRAPEQAGSRYCCCDSTACSCCGSHNADYADYCSRRRRAWARGNTASSASADCALCAS